MTVETYEAQPLTLDESAKEKLKVLIEEEGNPDIKLRVFVTGGGCSGFQYGFSFEDEAQEDDIEINEDGISLIVDFMSIQYLSGAVIRFKSDPIMSKFTIDNPHATTTCGCGSSFSI